MTSSLEIYNSVYDPRTRIQLCHIPVTTIPRLEVAVEIHSGALISILEGEVISSKAMWPSVMLACCIIL
jgi:hypothetical protein